MTDDDIVYVMSWCRPLRLTVHVRGTDDRPVVELRDKATGRVVGGKEFKDRLNAFLAKRGLY